jgi:hypothetical protein
MCLELRRFIHHKLQLQFDYTGSQLLLFYLVTHYWTLVESLKRERLLSSDLKRLTEEQYQSFREDGESGHPLLAFRVSPLMATSFPPKFGNHPSAPRHRPPKPLFSPEQRDDKPVKWPHHYKADRALGIKHAHPLEEVLPSGLVQRIHEYYLFTAY